LDTLKQNEGVRKRIENAELIGEEVRVTGNYSYDSTQMGGPGWVMVGDAFAFLDPVFSSGVYLAMSGAEQAAMMIATALREPQREVSLLRKGSAVEQGESGATRQRPASEGFDGTPIARQVRSGLGVN
jgi:flavin-dependent dehydrogenase